MKLFIDKKSDREPKVSIILPNYNSYRTIIPTVNSIINQSYKNWELIVVDDCSNEKTKKILTKYKKIKKILFFRQQEVLQMRDLLKKLLHV